MDGNSLSARLVRHKVGVLKKKKKKDQVEELNPGISPQLHRLESQVLGSYSRAVEFLRLVAILLDVELPSTQVVSQAKPNQAKRRDLFEPLYSLVD